MPQSKPRDRIAYWRGFFQKASSKDRNQHLRGMQVVFDAIEELWSQGKQVQLFEIDAPQELTSVNVQTPTRGLSNAAWNLLREKYMVENLRQVVAASPRGSRLLLCCHNFHWHNLRFLMKRPRPAQIRERYFGSFPEAAQADTARIGQLLAEENLILYLFWKEKRGLAAP